MNIIIDMDFNIIFLSKFHTIINIQYCLNKYNICSIIFRTEVNLRSPNSTLVVWLQNNSGCQKWNPSEDRVEALLEAFRPGRERDRDRQVLLSPKSSNLPNPFSV